MPAKTRPWPRPSACGEASGSPRGSRPLPMLQPSKHGHSSSLSEAVCAREEEHVVVCVGGASLEGGRPRGSSGRDAGLNPLEGTGLRRRNNERASALESGRGTVSLSVPLAGHARALAVGLERGLTAVSSGPRGSAFQRPSSRSSMGMLMSMASPGGGEVLREPFPAGKSPITLSRCANHAALYALGGGHRCSVKRCARRTPSATSHPKDRGLVSMSLPLLNPCWPVSASTP